MTTNPAVESEVELLEEDYAAGKQEALSTRFYYSKVEKLASDKSALLRNLNAALRDKKAAEQRALILERNLSASYGQHAAAEASLAAANQRAEEAFNAGIEAAASYLEMQYTKVDAQRVRQLKRG